MQQTAGFPAIEKMGDVCPWCESATDPSTEARYRRWKLHSAEDRDSDQGWTCLLSQYIPLKIRE